jgi:hypothetical protein
MSGTVTPGRAAGQPAGAALAPQPGGGRGRRRWAAAALAAVVVAGAAAGLSGAFGGSGSPKAGASGGLYHTSTATVTRRSLVSQTLVTATLGDAGSYSVVNQASGTITALPAAGQVVRQGHVLYEVSGSPVVLLYGQVPAYRALSEGMTGQDVAELNTDLVTLGYATRAALGPRSGWDYFSAETAYALERLQAHLGLTVTGTLPLGQAVFLPSAAKMTALGTGVVPGGAAQPGAVVLTATSVTPVVTISLDAAQQTEVKAGDTVSITLPDGATTPGVVSSVGTVASSSTSGSSGSGGESGGSGTPTITVQVALANPKAAGHLDQAPVTVAITTGSVGNALVVPVTALLAQASGGYAVEVTSGGGHHLVAVTPGLFDDAAGLVEVSGSGLLAGQHVVVPGL